MKDILSRSKKNINPINIDSKNLLTARDILISFDENIGAKIERKYEKLLGQNKPSFLRLFKTKIKSSDDIKLEKEKELGIAMTEFIIGDDIHNPYRKKLLQDVIKTEIACAYGNTYLRYIDYLETHEKLGESEIANIIRECFYTKSSKQ